MPSKGSRKQFCVNGHDTFVVGRYPSSNVTGACKACANSPIALQRGRENQWRRNGILNQDGRPFTQGDYDEAFHLQNGCCKICKRRTSLVADHDHVSHKFRGLLCTKHNKGIGFFEDDLEHLRAAIAYLGGLQS